MIATSETTKVISTSLATAHRAIGGAKKDAKNPHFQNDFASLESVIKASKAALEANGIFVTQAPGLISEGAIRLTTRLTHSSGEWIETVCDVPLQKRDAQGVGSAITYGRRYALMAALNIPATDDDGQEAVQPHVEEGPKRMSAAAAKREGYNDKIREIINQANDLDDLNSRWNMIEADYMPTLPLSWEDAMRDIYEAKRLELGA